jgi:large subunit ribosomal protein L3
MKEIYGRKIGMTRVFNEEGENLPVTVLELGPNVVFQVKTPEVDGYKAVQVGFGARKAQLVNRAETSHFAKAQKGNPEFVAEIRLDKLKGEVPEFNIGDSVTLDGMFKVGDKVDVVGRSVGKGFAGVMKRHGMKGAQTDSHGTHEYFRHAGSIGCRKFPGRVFKNKRMGGHMGDVRVMQLGLEVVDVRPSENLLLVKGSVPGAKNSYVYVRDAIKA